MMKNQPFLYPLLIATALMMLPGAATAENTVTGIEAIEQKLDEIVIPSVRFLDVPVSQVATILTEVSIRHDPGGDPPHGVNFVARGFEGQVEEIRFRANEPMTPVLILDPDRTAGEMRQVVTLAAQNLSLRRILEFISQETGARFDVTEDSVVIRPDDGRREIEFQGGSLGEFVDLVRAIARRHGETLNVFVSDEAAAMRFPPVHLRSVKMYDVMSALRPILQIAHPETQWITNPVGGVWMLDVRSRGEPAAQPDLRTQVFNLGNLVSHFSLDDITTALEIAWDLEGDANEELTIRVHEETGLLYIRSVDSRLRTAQQVLNALHAQNRWLSDQEPESERAQRMEQLQRALPTDQDQLQRAAEELRERRALRQQTGGN